MKASRPIACSHCQVELRYAGRKEFHEGTHLWAVLGGLLEAMEHRESLDLYFCPRCGRVEFFLVGIGERDQTDVGAADDVTDIEREHGSSDDEPESADAGPSWACPACGASVPANFEVCWRCGYARQLNPGESPDSSAEPELPEQTGDQVAQSPTPDKPQVVTPPTQWTCGNCGAAVPAASSICANCCTPRAGEAAS